MNLQKPFRNLSIGASAGMVYFSFLYLWCFLEGSGFAVMGVKNPAIEGTILSTYFAEIFFIQLRIFLVYLFLGSLLGLSASLFFGYFPLLSSLREKRFFFYLFLLIFLPLINLYFFILNIKKYPQLYTEFLYDRSGWRRELQVFLTDGISMSVVKIVGWLFLGLFLLALVNFLLDLLKRKERNKQPIKIVISLAILFFVFVILGRVRGKNVNTGPNLIFIGVDSLRSDSLNSSLTPRINKLSERSAVFSSAYVSLPRTFPQVITFLRGKYPHHHGVRHMFPSKEERNHRQGALPDILRKQGYATGVVTDFAGDVFSRMEIGLEVVKAPYFNFDTLLKQRSLEMHYFLLPYIANSLGRKIFPVLKEFAHNADPFLLADETKDLLKRFERKKKFFLFVFFSTPHFPYAAPYPYYCMHTLPGYRGRYKYHKPPSIYEKEGITENEIKQIRGLYEGAVCSVDEAIGEIFKFLEKEQLMEKTIIVITSDHGENLYENGWGIGHGEHFRGNRVVNVPLIIYNPLKDYPVKRIGALVRDVDLMPTLLEMLGLPTPEKIDGVSLLPLLEGKKKTLNLAAFAETGIWFSDVAEGFYQEKRIYYPDIALLGEIDNSYNDEIVIKEEYRPLIVTAKHRMLRNDDYKLIYMPTQKGIVFELYDLKKGPLETRNVATKQKEVLNKLKKQLYAWILQDRNVVCKNGYFLPLNY